MGQLSGVGRLSSAMKDLLIKWHVTEQEWRDRARNDYENKHIVALEETVRQTMREMDRLAQTLQRAKSECS